MSTPLFFSANPPPPTDDFTTTPLGPHTLFYLAITRPHTDTYTLHGPTTSFSHLLPLIHSITSDSPLAIDKLAALSSTTDVWGTSSPNTSFHSAGFTRLVVPGQRGIYTLLELLREEDNQPVHDALPAPVYVLTAHGPLSNAPNQLGHAGVAATSRFVGSFVGKEEARDAAEWAMGAMLEGTEGVARSECWGAREKGKEKGGGVLIAMGVGRRWEVRVGYEEEVLGRVREGEGGEGEEWGGGWVEGLRSGGEGMGRVE